MIAFGQRKFKLRIRSALQHADIASAELCTLIGLQMLGPDGYFFIQSLG